MRRSRLKIFLLYFAPQFSVYTKFGIDPKLRETAAHVIAMSVLVLNLRKIQCAVFQLLAYLRAIFSPQEKWDIVQ